MNDALDTLTQLARRLTGRLEFEALLDEVVVHTAQALGVRHASVRLLDARGKSLIAVARAGRPLHDRPQPFDIGVGLLGWIVQHGEPLRLGDATADPRFEPRPGMKDELRSFLGVPLTAGESTTGVLSAVSTEASYFDADHEQLATLIAAMVSPWVEVARLSRLSRVDPLTGALNRRGLDESIPVEAIDELEGPLSVVMADLDHFKRINDRHGHAAGDEVLRAVTTRIANVLRVGDAVVRYGGEELLLVLPGADQERAVRVAERARRSLADQPIRVGDDAIQVTASFGVAQRRDQEGRDTLIGRADEAMYRAKEAGRDRVCQSE